MGNPPVTSIRRCGCPVTLGQSPWEQFLEEAVEAAISPASVEVLNGRLKPAQISERVDRAQLTRIAQKLLDLTYSYSAKDLPAIADTHLAE